MSLFTHSVLQDNICIIINIYSYVCLVGSLVQMPKNYSKWIYKYSLLIFLTAWPWRWGITGLSNEGNYLPSDSVVSQTTWFFSNIRMRTSIFPLHWLCLTFVSLCWYLFIQLFTYLFLYYLVFTYALTYSHELHLFIYFMYY